MLDIQHVRKFLRAASVLQNQGGRWYAAPSPWAPLETAESYTTDDLCSLDERLEIIIPELVSIADRQLEGHKPATTKLMFGAALNTTLDYWAGPAHMVTSEGDKVLYASLYEFMEDKSTTSEEGVLIAFHGYQVLTCPDLDGTDVEYVTNTPLCVRAISRTWLTTTYPNWEQRKLVGESLGYNGKALLDIVFSATENPQLTIAMSSIDDLSA